MLNGIRKIYKEIKPTIEKRLENFKNVWKTYDDDHLFAELSFCLLTPQSKAVVCDKAIKSLLENDILLSGSKEEIQEHLKGVRFKRNKSGYIVLARNMFFSDGKFTLREKIKDDIFSTREWFVKNVKGMGYKEASHFLRNIGFGENISILDRHILKNLTLLKVIDEVPKSLTKKKYLEIEDNMREFSKDINIPLDHLDLVFWYKEAGKVFK